MSALAGSESVQPPSAIDADALAAWLEKRRRVRRMFTFIAAVVLLFAGAGVITLWSIFGAAFSAKSKLQAEGFSVDWDVTPSTFFRGGKTSVHFRGQTPYFARPARGDELREVRNLRHVEDLDTSMMPETSLENFSVVAELPDLIYLQLSTNYRPATYGYGQQTTLVAFDDRVLDYVVGLKKLKLLSLSGSRITDAGVAKIAKLDSLESLDLEETRITDKCLETMKTMKGLKSIRIAKTKITPAAIARFQTARPDVEVIDGRFLPPE